MRTILLATALLAAPLVASAQTAPAANTPASPPAGSASTSGSGGASTSDAGLSPAHHARNTRHAVYHVAHTSHHASSGRGRGSAPNADHSADQLNAQSLQNSQGGGQSGAQPMPSSQPAQ